MIARVWRGEALAGKADAYQALLDGYDIDIEKPR